MSKTDMSKLAHIGLFNCVAVLGFSLGWRYWRIAAKIRRNPAIRDDWARACRRAAISAPEPQRGIYLDWAEKLEP